MWKYICKIKVDVFAILKNVANWPPKTSYTNLDSPRKTKNFVYKKTLVLQWLIQK